MHDDLLSGGVNDPLFGLPVVLPVLYADWTENFKELFRLSTDFYSWPLYHHQYRSVEGKTAKWESVSGVTLAGDAAHTSTPFAGEGVNCAITGALALADKIAAASSTEEGDLDQAIRSYEEGMFPRGIDLITRSVLNGELMFHNDGPEAFLRTLKGG